MPYRETMITSRGTGRTVVGSGRSVWVLAAAAPLVVVVAAVAAWWLVGDGSSRMPAGTGLDYAFDPLSVDPGLVTGAGIIATAVAAAGLIAGIVGVRAGRLRGGWLALLVWLFGCGVVAGAAVRVLTAGVIGANIGAGMVALFVGPLLGLALLFAFGCACYLVYTRPR